MQKDIFFVKHSDLIKQMTLEEKCYLLSGKDFWQTQSAERLGVRNMVLSGGPHGVRRQADSTVEFRKAASTHCAYGLFSEHPVNLS